MSQELQDEVISINSIYGEETLIQSDGEPLVYLFTLPTSSEISLRLEFPLDYPDAPPAVLGTHSVGADVAKGEGTYFLDLVRDVVFEVYTPGSPCIFDVIEETGSRWQTEQQIKHGNTDGRVSAEFEGDYEENVGGANGQLDTAEEDVYGSFGKEPPWSISEAIAEKKSVFVARSVQVTSVEQAKHFLSHLLATDRKVAKATHNITAWRIRTESGVQYQDCDDDGESAAGSRVLHLLELMGVWNVMVVVTRWYGGIHLGPDRFRIINQTARDALVRGGFEQAKNKRAKK